jgi:uncharacterized membrane protein
LDLEPLVRWLHVIGAAVLLGTGAGIAFFMVKAHRTGDARVIASVAAMVVEADYIFTTTAVVAQPITGFLLVLLTGWDIREGWIGLSLGLYVLAGMLWLPVVWMQKRMLALAQASAVNGTGLPPQYYRLYRYWFFSGIPAFAAVTVIFWLMLNRPEIKL